MGLPIECLEVSIFEWPDRFFVECEEDDLEYYKAFPEFKDHDPRPPYLVDLSEYEDGWCACLDFTFNIIPFLGEPFCRTRCKHLYAARAYRYRFDECPIKLPSSLVNDNQTYYGTRNN